MRCPVSVSLHTHAPTCAEHRADVHVAVSGRKQQRARVEHPQQGLQLGQLVLGHSVAPAAETGGGRSRTDIAVWGGKGART